MEIEQLLLNETWVKVSFSFVGEQKEAEINENQNTAQQIWEETSKPVQRGTFIALNTEKIKHLESVI